MQLKKEINELLSINIKLTAELKHIKEQTLNRKIVTGIKLDSHLIQTERKQSKTSNLLQSDYLRLLKQIKHKESKQQNLADLQILTELLSRKKRSNTANKRRFNKSSQSVSSATFNTSVGISNLRIKRTSKANRKEERKIRSVPFKHIKSEKSFKNLINATERLMHQASFSNVKERLKKNGSHTHVAENTTTSQTKLENQKKTADNLLRLTSKILNRKVSKHIL